MNRLTTESDRNLNLFAMSFPVVNGEPVMQGHADYCAANGHATHKVDGVQQSYCPRCGDELPLSAISTTDLSNELWDMESRDSTDPRRTRIMRELLTRDAATAPEPVEESLDDEVRAVKEFAEDVLGMSPEPWQLSMMVAGAGRNRAHRAVGVPVIPHFHRRAYTAYEQADYDLSVTHGTKYISMSLRRTMGEDRPMSYSLTPDAARELAANLIARADRIEGKA